MPRWPPLIFSPPRFTATGTTPSCPDSSQTDAVIRAQTLSDDRNIVAHSPFESHESGGVVFRRVTISGPKKQPKTLQRTPKRWTPKQLDAKCERMDRIRGELERLKSSLRPVVSVESAIGSSSTVAVSAEVVRLEDITKINLPAEK